MHGQTSIEVPEFKPAPKFCFWCGRDAVGDVEVEKARMGTRKGRQILVRAALTQPACSTHIDIADRPWNKREE